MELTPAEFWQLSWYDFILYLMRHNKRTEKLKYEHETRWLHTRALMAVIHNSSFGRTETKRPEDFVKLSFDEVESDEPKEDLFKKMKEQFGSRIK